MTKEFTWTRNDVLLALKLHKAGNSDLWSYLSSMDDDGYFPMKNEKATDAAFLRILKETDRL